MLEDDEREYESFFEPSAERAAKEAEDKVFSDFTMGSDLAMSPDISENLGMISDIASCAEIDSKLVRTSNSNCRRRHTRCDEHFSQW